MRAEIFAAALVIAASVGGVRYWESRSGSFGEDNGSAYAATRDAGKSTRGEAYAARWDREVRIAANPDMQYYVTAAVNNAPASFLVDTGAGLVALRESDARKAGVYTSREDFTQPVRTANGETKAALVKLREIEIGGILVRDVDAFVLADDQLGVNLLGMSFLSRLESVEARGDELVIRG